MQLEILGLGRMGLPIARHLRAAGHEVVGRDLDPARVSLFEDASVAARHAGGAGRTVDALLTVLPGPAELRRAMLGPEVPDAYSDDAGDAGREEGVVDRSPAGGALAGLRTGALWVDLTSGDPRVARELAANAAAQGVAAVGAPMAGGPRDAEQGTLGFFARRRTPRRSSARSRLLRTLGDAARIERAGDDVGAGHVAKLLANTLWFGQVAAVTEALLIGHAQGLEIEQLAGILRRSAGGSAFIDRHLDALLDGDYLESFGIDRVVEELDTVAALASEAGLPAPLANLVAALHREALERFGPVGGELLVAKLLEERVGTRIRRPR